MIEELNPYRDPYAGFEAQSMPERTYKAGTPGTLVIFISALPGLGTGLYLLYNGYRYPCTLIIAVIVITIFSYILLQQIRSITCTEQGIRFRYWLRPSLYRRWEEICGLRAKPGRVGYYARLLSCNHTLSLLPIVFPIGSYLAVRDASTVLRTITERASLTFIEGNLAGNAVYQQISTDPGKVTTAKILLARRHDRGEKH